MSRARISRKETNMKTIALALVLFTASVAGAQTPADPSGHWKGSIEIPGRTLELEIDLARNTAGELVGAASSADAKNIPLAKVALIGQTMTFYTRSDQPFTGTLAPSGKSMAGTLTLSGYSLPLELTRTGDAKIEPPPASAPITKALEGRWSGALRTGAGDLRVVLTLANRPDGSSSGMFISLDEGGMMLPVRITQKAADVTIQLNGIDGVYSGTLNAAGTELTGAFAQGGASLPLVLTR
jgi:hypothetical protein